MTVYNKLVRDHIPEIILQDSKVCEYTILDDESYLKELFNKLKEEADEVVHTMDNHELIEEIADVLEVIDAIKKFKGISSKEIEAIKKKKTASKGGFEKRYFLIETIEDDCYD